MLRATDCLTDTYSEDDVRLIPDVLDSWRRDVDNEEVAASEERRAQSVCVPHTSHNTDHLHPVAGCADAATSLTELERQDLTGIHPHNGLEANRERCVPKQSALC